MTTCSIRASDWVSGLTGGAGRPLPGLRSWDGPKRRRPASGRREERSEKPAAECSDHDGHLTLPETGSKGGFTGARFRPPAATGARSYQTPTFGAPEMNSGSTGASPRPAGFEHRTNPPEKFPASPVSGAHRHNWDITSRRRPQRVIAGRSPIGRVFSKPCPSPNFGTPRARGGQLPKATFGGGHHIHTPFRFGC